MGEEFRRRRHAFAPDRPNLFPLLHVTIARGKSIESHDYFTGQEGGNYFHEVGRPLADLLIDHAGGRDIWVS